MLFLLSPAKSLKFDSVVTTKNLTKPVFVDDAAKIAKQMRKVSALNLEKLMKISPQLADLNFKRFADFSLPENYKGTIPALFFFDGDAYKKIPVENYSAEELVFAQSHLRILSGLYGILRPLDLMAPYRLEMGTKIKDILGNSLYDFWQEKLTNFLNEELVIQQEKTVINLASSEYSSAILPKKIQGKIINIIFKEKKGDAYKIIGISAKKARGGMVHFAIKNRIKNSADLKNFDWQGYEFHQEFSDDSNWCFCRG